MNRHCKYGYLPKLLYSSIFYFSRGSHTSPYAGRVIKMRPVLVLYGDLDFLEMDF